jgi:valyl-tRNA synthetase
MAEEMKQVLSQGGRNIRALVEKKNLSEAMAAAYDPKLVESGWQTWWESKGYFTPDAERALNLTPDQKFVMMIPPPNVTGSLHLGHALTSSIEDTLARWNRMRGKETLWVPGVDHAGIATQTVVEKALQREEGKTRHDFTREEFLKKVWEWKEQYGNRICNQFRMMGVSVDWSRFAFTMDEARSQAVTEAFVRLFEKGLVYRANRLVNWSSTLRTAISDLEVEYEDFTQSTWLPVKGHQGKYEFGVLHKFAYPVADSDEKIIVATTRIETMLGDTAVAVHPNDPRYTHLIGKRLVHPFIPDRDIRVIADPLLVNMEFGTGAVKVTPAHDHNDFACGQRHGLDMINILTDEGRINDNGGKYAGMMRFDCRIQIQKDLEELGLYIEKENNVMRIGFCERSGDVIEPLLKPQWWVSCGKTAARATEAVRSGELKILPEFHEKTWYMWLENIKDWCISRQLWWGHRCPAYLVTVKNSEGVAYYTPDTNNNDHWVCGRSYEEALAKAEKLKRSQDDIVEVEQDPDVLDTWFSSGLFPFSTLGWPNEDSVDYRAFYPGTLLETGHDILFFWVARMVMMGLDLTDKLPFNTVYLHAMVRDAQGRKMSKSLGNVIDPLEVISGCSLDTLIEKLKQSNLSAKEVEKSKQSLAKEFPSGIQECGADALRLGLLAYTIQGRNINLDIQRVVGYRQFMNKLWNASRFALSNFPEDFSFNPTFLDSSTLSLADSWILNKLYSAIEKTNTCLENYNFGDVVQTLYSFWLYELCDVYLEVIKPVMRNGSAEQQSACRNTLYLCLEKGLQLLHPMIPFVTEELYHRLPAYPGKLESICITPYPSAVNKYHHPDADYIMEQLMNIIKPIRSIQASLNIYGKKPLVYLKSPEEKIELFGPNLEIIQTLAKCGEIHFTLEPPAKSVMNTAGDVDVYLVLPESVNINSEIAKLEKKLQQNAKLMEGVKNKMSAADYETKTPQNIKDEFSKKLANYEEVVSKLQEEIAKLRSLLI